jgi:transposase
MANTTSELGVEKRSWSLSLAPMGAWANIPPKRNRKEPICFSPYLYRGRNLVERFFNKISSVGVSPRGAVLDHEGRCRTRRAIRCSGCWVMSAFGGDTDGRFQERHVGF